MDVATAIQRGRELEQIQYPKSADQLGECDLVMKGGITSGVVYPLAACELARTWKFRSVGGSSAGAIAAALVAAAEYGRDSGGFQRLAALPGEIGPVLPKLFTPGPRTKTAHAAVMASLDPAAKTSAKVTRVLRVLLRSQRQKFVTALIIAVVVALLAALALTGVPADAVTAIRFVLVAAVFAALGTAVAAGIALAAEVRATSAGLVEQGFGVCLGSDGPAAEAPTADDPGALTDWLSARIDGVAGLNRPLLVADLAERGIDLRVMTTNLTLGQPMTFPFADRRFLFDPEELAQYFPPAVITALLAADEPAATEGGRPLVSAAGNPLFRLPEADRLPVILAARISLSFPGLISAVPLYTVDFSRRDPKDQVAVRCWFSDGGMTSNFPIHFFDSLWPQRPTFALDLRGYHADHLDSDVYYSATRPRAPRVTAITSIPRFASAILTTMQYWADDAQCTLPGYRDRVVEVHLHPNEGGLNLQMPPDLVALVAEKGRQAAEALGDPQTGFNFEQHRWNRYLTSMGRMQDAVVRMNQRYTGAGAAGLGGVRDLIGRAPDFGQQRRSRAWTDKARARTEKLLAFADGEPDFTQDSPRPEPVMRITPKF